MIKTDILIVGSGLSGVTAATVLAEAGYKVLIIDKRKHYGGNCYDYKNDHNITIHQYGPHIFHTNHSRVWNFLKQYSTFEPYQHKVLSYAAGQMVPFPINSLTLRELFGLNLHEHEVLAFLNDEVQQSKFNHPVQNFRDVIVAQVGERLYDLFFKNYTAKQWGRDPEELSCEVAGRIPVRTNRDVRYFSDKYQGIPARGYTTMMHKMLEHPNISIWLGVDYFEIREQIQSELVIYTGMLDQYFHYQYGELEYRSLRLEFETRQQEYFQPVAVVNYPNDYDWTRITEFKHFLTESSPCTTLLYEYPQYKGDPYYVVLTAENLRRRELYLRDVAALEQSGRILFTGRLAEYKYYNMDQAIEASLTKVEKWLHQRNRGVS